jgi:hypothetical protein
MTYSVVMNHPADIGTASRPIGSMKMLLEDLYIFEVFILNQSLMSVPTELTGAEWLRASSKKQIFFLLNHKLR